MSELEKRKPVTHKHPAVAAAIHVLKEAGGGPLRAVTIFQRAFDRGLLAATAYNTLRARLSQHQRCAAICLARKEEVQPVVVIKMDAGYMLRAEGIPSDTPIRACAPNRPPLPEPLQDDPLAVVPTPRPKRRKRQVQRVRDIRVTPEWLYNRGAGAEMLKWARLARWRSQWRDEEHPTARDLLTGFLPPRVNAWFLAALPLEADLRAKLQGAAGISARIKIILEAEGKAPKPLRPAADKAVEGAVR